MNTSTRVGLAGFGAWGQMHAKALAKIEEAEVTAVFCHSERSQAAATELMPRAKLYRDYDRMLSDGGLDVVSVTVPNNLHAAFTVGALEAGADVFLEKPLGITLDECLQVVEATRRTGRLVALDHELRVSHQWSKVRELVEEGRLGRIRYQHFSLFRHPFRPGSGGWRYEADRVGSWLLEELVHFFDLVLWYGRENGPPTRVRAVSDGEASGLFQNFAAELEWPDGSCALLSQCLTGFEHHTLLEVTGTGGAVRTWWSGERDRTLLPSFEMKIRLAGHDEVEAVLIPRSGEVFELEANLRAALAGFREGRSILAPEEALVSIAVCLAAEQGARTGLPVEPTFPAVPEA